MKKKNNIFTFKFFIIYYCYKLFFSTLINYFSFHMPSNLINKPLLPIFIAPIYCSTALNSLFYNNSYMFQLSSIFIKKLLKKFKNNYYNFEERLEYFNPIFLKKNVKSKIKKFKLKRFKSSDKFIKITRLHFKFIFSKVFKKQKLFLFRKHKIMNYFFNIRKHYSTNRKFYLNFFIKKSLSNNLNFSNKFIKFRNNPANSKKIKKKIKITRTTSKFNLIFNTFLGKIFKKNITILNYNYCDRLLSKRFHLISNSLLRKFYFFKKVTTLLRIIKIFVASVVYRDSSIIIPVIKDVFHSVHYSKHNIYFNFFNYLIKYFSKFYLKKFKAQGLKLEFHGKLGVGGNSKKRSYYYTIGKFSNSSKKLKVDYNKGQFWTDTGAVGFSYYIFY